MHLFLWLEKVVIEWRDVTEEIRKAKPFLLFWSAAARRRFNAARLDGRKQAQKQESLKKFLEAYTPLYNSNVLFSIHARQAGLLQSGVEPPHSKKTLSKYVINKTHWHHAPTHLLFEQGVFMVTAATYQKELLFHGEARLDLLHNALLACADEFGWELHAWAVFPNHYHFVARSPKDVHTLKKLTGKLHTTTAKEINLLDKTPGRKVWHQFWDSRLTFDNSYYARLHYVHQNPVRHGVAGLAENYRWCSAAQFALHGEPTFRKMVNSFPIDALHVPEV